MGNYKDTSIKEIIKGIRDEKYILPDMQRPFVWGDNLNEFEQKVTSLFDSILRGYPIGTMLFWKKNKQEMENDGINALKFLNNSGKSINEKIENLSSEKEYFLVLDGQQRMTIFNLVFNGIFEDTYRKNKRRRTLYMNLLNDSNINDYDVSENLNEFKLLENSNEFYLDGNKLRYRVRDILEIESKTDKKYEISEKFNLDNSFQRLVEKNLEKLHDNFIKDNISYFEISNKKSDEEALEIFVRVNSKGMVLSYSDLLFSKITQFWKKLDSNKNIDVRDMFESFLNGNDGINLYGEKFDFDNDFILKTSLALIDTEIRYRLKNFNKDNIENIKNSWENIKSSIIRVVEFLIKIGINSNKVLSSKNSIIPLIYFVNNKGLKNTSIELNTQNYELMKKYLYIVLLNGSFGGQSDQLLTDLRELIKNSDSNVFPLDQIMKKIDQRKGIRKGEQIFDLLDTIKYNSDKSRIILSILYGNDFTIKSQQDHLFPQKKTKKYLEENGKDSSLVDNIANIQILENENQKKGDTDFEVYRKSLEGKIESYDKNNFIPTLKEENNEFKSYTNEYFEKFLEKRKKIIFDKIKPYFDF